MKIIKIFTVLAVVAGLTTIAFIPIKPAAANRGFAVIELFTSEGCSSCPPADELVGRIQKEYKGQPVYILAFHVDYWNRLGWPDVFSSAEYSVRQSEYAKYLNLQQVYTPQIVVNGKKEFVGSEESILRSAIKTDLQKPASAQITLGETKIDHGKATLHYQTEGNGNNSVLLLALVERSAQSNVKAGENKGHILSHVQIIRQLDKVSLTKGNSGTQRINLPKDFNPQKWEIIALIQNTQTGEIIGATKQVFSLAS